MKKQKYKLKGEIDRDLRRVQWKNTQIMICGWYMIVMAVMIVIAALNQIFEWWLL